VVVGSQRRETGAEDRRCGRGRAGRRRSASSHWGAISLLPGCARSAVHRKTKRIPSGPSITPISSRTVRTASFKRSSTATTTHPWAAWTDTTMKSSCAGRETFRFSVPKPGKCHNLRERGWRRTSAFGGPSAYLQARHGGERSSAEFRPRSGRYCTSCLKAHEGISPEFGGVCVHGSGRIASARPASKAARISV
jgi:hypothetical protein